MLQAPPPQARGRVRLTEINPHLVCVLCHGYFIDATTMAECPHSFCRSCIVLYLETKSYCPICEVQIHKTKPHLNLKPDKTLQDIVYKLVPGLFHDEMRRRRAFYAKYPNRDLYLCPEARGAGVERIIYSPEDSVSLSIEYYDEKDDLDRRDAGHLLPNTESYSVRSDREREEWAPTRPGASYEGSSQPQGSQSPTPEYKDGLKRFLQCPAAVTMRLLKKFIRLKFGLSQACTVEILYRRESLPDSYSLMDIAYIYTWKRNGPMRFYYRIHMPTPLRTVMPALKPSSEPIRDTIPRNLKSPELLDAVGLRPKLPEMAPTTLVESESEGIKEVACVREVEVRPLKEDERLAESEERPLKVDERPDEVEERPSKVEERPPKMEENPLNVEEKPSKVEETPPKVEERPKITPAEDTAVSLLLALSNGHGVQEPPKEQVVAESRPEPVAATTTVPPPPAVVARSPNANNGVFKVPTSMTKRFVINGGKLVPVKNKQSGGKSNKTGEKTKVNGKTVNGEHSFVNDRFTNPLGLPGTGPLGLSGGRLPPGSPRPPPKSEKAMKTKYMAPSGLLANRLSPEVTLSQNKSQPEVYQPPQISANQPKPIRTQVKPNRPTANGQPAHRKEVNRLEQIVQICLKKETSQKEASERKEAEVRDEAVGEKRSGTLNVEVNAKSDAESEGGARAAHGDASIQPTDHVASPSNTDRVDTETSILKRKLNDTRRVGSFAADPTKRRLVTPDVSIELMANPAKERERKREPSDLSTLTKRFLNDIQRMKKLETELKINKLDHMCASTVKIEKVPAPSSLKVPTPKSSPSGNEKSKAIDGSDFSSENDQLFIDIRNKCEAFKRKNPEPVSVAIERVSEDRTTKSSSNQNSPAKGIDSTTEPKSDASPRPSGTHKKLPRLIEINAPPRPKLSPIVPDLKQKIKMTTVRKEVPIGKEVPLVRRDCNGALDLSSGMSPPSGKQTATGNKSPFHRSSALEKSPTTPSPLLAMSSFPMPDVNRASPIRIPTLKSKTSPTPRPSSLSSSSPSPPAESKDVFPSSAAFQQLYRQQMEFQSRMLASQANNNWSRDPLMAKKLEEWMRIMNIPHQLMFPSQESRK